MTKNGFTLIEFLLVAALIAILMTMGFSSYGKSLSRGRDSKRLTDMQEVQKGFELYYARHNSYDLVDTMFGDTEVFPQGKPNPPVGSQEYGGWANGTDFMYCAQLENGPEYGNSICTGDINVSGNCGFASTGSINAFCVENSQ